jgi:hypothetical protein
MPKELQQILQLSRLPWQAFYWARSHPSFFIRRRDWPHPTQNFDRPEFLKPQFGHETDPRLGDRRTIPITSTISDNSMIAPRENSSVGFCNAVATNATVAVKVETSVIDDNCV